jgi:hypothetical protein
VLLLPGHTQPKLLTRLRSDFANFTFEETIVFATVPTLHAINFVVSTKATTPVCADSFIFLGGGVGGWGVSKYFLLNVHENWEIGKIHENSYLPYFSQHRIATFSLTISHPGGIRTRVLCS